MRLSKHYCEGKTIDDAPAFAHACKVAVMFTRHIPDAAPEMIAAALLHDAPEFKPDMVVLDVVLKYAVGDGIAPLVNAIHAEHAAMMSGVPPRVAEPPVTQIMAADKTVAFQALVTRASRAPSEAEFWDRRPTLRSLFPWFVQWCELAAPHLPESLHVAVTLALAQLEARALSELPTTAVSAPGDGAAPLRLPE